MNRRDAGFSLVELMVALALVAVIASLAFGSLRFGARVWERDAALRETMPLDLALSRIAERLEGLHVEALRQADLSVRVPFEGSRDALVFLTQGGVGATGLQAWRFAIRGDGDRLRLEGHRVPAARAAELAGIRDWGVPVLTIAGLDKAAFAYAGTVEPGSAEGPRWQATWPDAARAPRLVRLDLVRGAERRVRAVRLRTGG